MAETRCFMDISINGKARGRIVYKLYNNIVPITCHNFLQLCDGSERLGETTGKKLSYQGSTFHRVIKGFMIQGGDFSKNDGTGGECVYGNNGTFDDENFNIKFSKPGILGMANRGPNTNGSQFFITTSECHDLDEKHVAFGEVVDGYQIVSAIEKCEVNNNNRPMADVVITNCGRLVQVEKRGEKVRSESQEIKKIKKREAKAEESKFFSSIKESDLPELPVTHNFLDRGSPEKSQYVKKPSDRSSRHISSQRRFNLDGVKVKGRGVTRYRAAHSSSNFPHWKIEERRMISQKAAKEIIAREKKIAERGTTTDETMRERSSSVSSRDSVERENSSRPGPSSNDLKIEDEEPMELDGGSTVAEHIRMPFSSTKRKLSSPNVKRYDSPRRSSEAKRQRYDSPRRSSKADRLSTSHRTREEPATPVRQKKLSDRKPGRDNVSPVRIKSSSRSRQEISPIPRDMKRPFKDRHPSPNDNSPDNDRTRRTRQNDRSVGTHRNEEYLYNPRAEKSHSHLHATQFATSSSSGTPLNERHARPKSSSDRNSNICVPKSQNVKRPRSRIEKVSQHHRNRSPRRFSTSPSPPR